jgi:hypothetical protein
VREEDRQEGPADDAHEVEPKRSSWPGVVPAIHAGKPPLANRMRRALCLFPVVHASLAAWMAGTSPATTAVGAVATAFARPTACARLTLEPSKPPQFAVDLLETTFSD